MLLRRLRGEARRVIFVPVHAPTEEDKDDKSDALGQCLLAMLLYFLTTGLEMPLIHAIACFSRECRHVMPFSLSPTVLQQLAHHLYDRAAIRKSMRETERARRLHAVHCRCGDKVYGIHESALEGAASTQFPRQQPEEERALVHPLELINDHSEARVMQTPSNDAWVVVRTLQVHRLESQLRAELQKHLRGEAPEPLERRKSLSRAGLRRETSQQITLKEPSSLREHIPTLLHSLQEASRIRDQAGEDDVTAWDAFECAMCGQRVCAISPNQERILLPAPARQEAKR
ncbi:hypothetical protein Poli38472_011614 [Pythium oligandrum]|uniref:Uncharacterized protein n=1 Tax=Pythium oligandrum TaxID=41045 RepID=A0A8K1CJI5_PYTOL|nr:hypothetical protein Poli38472_011614 [Pythium oligandrum]|eukprot:TMW64734.1 hypothetical protein Poli38472_011614 [Pythium oligandrum]